MFDTPCHGSNHLWLTWKESIQNCRCYRVDTAGGTDGRTDGRTEWNQYTPQQLRCSRGIINIFLSGVQNIPCHHVWNSVKPLHWRHNGRDDVPNHQPHDCLLNRLFRRRSKNTSKLRVTGLCEGNSPGTGEFPAQMASKAENVSIWWRHQAKIKWDYWTIALRWRHNERDGISNHQPHDWWVNELIEVG